MRIEYTSSQDEIGERLPLVHGIQQTLDLFRKLHAAGKIDASDLPIS